MKAADLPPLPAPDANGNYPAVEYARASLARKVIRDRVAAGLSQRELARRAGVRVETLCRIETGKHSPSIASIDKIDRALRQAARSQTPPPRKTKANCPKTQSIWMINRARGTNQLDRLSFEPMAWLQVRAGLIRLGRI